MLKVISGGVEQMKPSKPKLSSRLMALAAKCDDKGNLPPEHSGELFQLMLEMLEQTRKSNREIERLARRTNETEIQVNELAAQNEALILFNDFIGEFLDVHDLKDDCLAFLDKKIDAMPEIPIN